MTVVDSGFMMETGDIYLRCSAEEERRIIKELVALSEANLTPGNSYYRWFASWQRYAGQSYDEPSSPSVHDTLLASFSRPGPIDNSHLLCDTTSIQKTYLELNLGLEEGRDLVPQEAWEKLLYWYKGRPELPRKLISQGLHEKNFAVEVYPLRLNLIDSWNGNQYVLRFSKQAFIYELYERLCVQFGLWQEKAGSMANNHFLFVVCGHNCSSINERIKILLEASEYGSFPSEPGAASPETSLALGRNGPSTSTLTNTSDSHSSSCLSKGTNSLKGGCPDSLSSRFESVEDEHGSVTAKKKEVVLGLVGLQNLGNTCFMNSALQCLSHTPPFVEYFFQDYTTDINTGNPLGKRGELANAFGDLLMKLWIFGEHAFPPRVFKDQLSCFAPQFSGYDQHDAHEFLIFLLNGLHEDLNRVKLKPYIESKDYDCRPNKEIAEESWMYHMAINDSMVVDKCQGQSTSTLCCPDCGKISITFDHFMSLSLPLPLLPLPATVTRTMIVTVFYGDGSGLPMPYTVTVTKSGYLNDLIQALTSACCLTCDERLLLAEVYGHQIYQYLENLITPLSNIKNEDCLIAYRLPNLAGLTRLEIIHQRNGKYVSDSLRSGERKLLGSPLITYIEEDCVCGAVIDRCVTRVFSPLKRSTYLTKFPCNKKNAFLPSEINSVIHSSDTQSLSQSVVDEKDDEKSNSDLTFHFSLVDSDGKISSPLEADTLVRSSQSIKILLDWSDKDHEMYDYTYLEHIPEVKAAKQEVFSLPSILEAYLKEEPLGPDDMWRCPRCKEFKRALMKLDLWRLPDILLFHLKRFTYDRYTTNKLDALVNFPIHNFDSSKFMGDVSKQRTYLYELYAIINHYGDLCGGHYTAMIKLIEENKWYHFDDSHVSPINETDIKTSAAYVLFYRRVQA